MGMGQKSVGVGSQGTSQGWKKILHWVEVPLVMGGQERSLLKHIQYCSQSICYKYCIYLNFQEKHGKGREKVG